MSDYPELLVGYNYGVILMFLQIVAKTPWADKKVNVTLTTSGATCADVTVYWKVDWQTSLGD